jgi:putative spermidine/putrescine transport system permease protein
MRKSRFLLFALAVVLFFLLGPFLVILVASFGSEAIMTFPPKGFSMEWFVKVFNVEMFRNSFGTSLQTAILATLTALVLGFPVAYAIVRFSFAGKNTIEVLFSSPAIVPGLVIGFALLRFFVYVTAMPVFLGLYIGHTAILFPYTVRVISSSLYNLDPSIEEAAISLGASRLGTFIRVVLPNVRAGVVAAFILAFITSFNNVPISLFLTGPGVATLPIQMLVYMEYYFDPTIAALSSLIILFTILIVQGAERLLGISKYV